MSAVLTASNIIFPKNARVGGEGTTPRAAIVQRTTMAYDDWKKLDRAANDARREAAVSYRAALGGVRGRTSPPKPPQPPRRRCGTCGGAPPTSCICCGRCRRVPAACDCHVAPVNSFWADEYWLDVAWENFVAQLADEDAREDELVAYWVTVEGVHKARRHARPVAVRYKRRHAAAVKESLYKGRTRAFLKGHGGRAALRNTAPAAPTSTPLPLYKRPPLPPRAPPRTWGRAHRAPAPPHTRPRMHPRYGARLCSAQHAGPTHGHTTHKRHARHTKHSRHMHGPRHSRA